MSDSDKKPEHWNDDKLDRYKQARLLKDFLDQQYESGFHFEDKTKSFVLNLDAEWGYGKTFFLNRFSKDLEKEHIVLRYNAWANDYAKDPLLSFLSQVTRELSEQLNHSGETPEANEVKRKEFLNNALRVIKSAGKAAAPKLLTAGITTLVLGFPIFSGSSEESQDSDESDQSTALSTEDQEAMTRTIGASVEAAMASASSDLFEEENSRRVAVESFRKSLGDIVEILTEQEESGAQSKSKKAPIFILIDELDRCRPDFTIELIECVKHLFSVDGLYFIFATDGQQLQAALSGLYGESFDAEIYFNRIFNKEIGLHIPDQRHLSGSLIDEYGLSNATTQFNLILYAKDSNNSERLTLAEDFRIVAEFFGLDLRSQKQLLSTFHALILARSRRELKTYTIPVLCLIVIWQRKKNLFRRIRSTPHSFRVEADITRELKGISSGGVLDIGFSAPTRDIASPHQQNEIKETVTHALLVFITMYTHNPLKYIEKLNSGSNNRTGHETEYVRRYKAEVHSAGMDARKSNPLGEYFDQITMVS